MHNRTVPSGEPHVTRPRTRRENAEELLGYLLFVVIVWCIALALMASAPGGW